MQFRKPAVAAAVALFVFAAPAFAERIGWVKVTNPRPRPVAVEYRIGPFTDCRKNNDYVGSRMIGPGQTWTLEVRGEGNACIRVAGTLKWWRNKVNAGQTHAWTVE